MKTHLYIIFILITSSISFGQSASEKLTSLLREYDHWKFNDLKKSEMIANEAFKLSSQFQNDSLKFITYYNTVDILFKQRRIKLVNTKLNELLVLAKKSKYPLHLAMYYELNANVKRRLNEYANALTSSIKAEKISKEGGFIYFEHKTLINRSLIYYQTKGEEYSIKYLKEVIDNPAFSNEHLRAASFILLSTYYGENLASNKKYKLKAIAIAKNTKNLLLKHSAYSSYSNFLLKTEQYNEGFKYLNLVEKYAKQLNYDSGLYRVYASRADYHYDLKDYPKCIENYNIAISKYGKYVPDNIRAYGYWVLADAYYFNRQFEKGYIYQEKVILLKDSIFNRERNEIFQRLNTEYEVERKNSKIALLQKEKDLERQRRNTAIIGGSLLLIPLLLLVFFYRYRMRIQKTIKEQADQLHEQEIAQLQQEQKIKRIEGYIEGEEKEKNRIALELHDGIGGQLAGIQHLANHLSSDKNAEQLSKDLQQVARNVRLLSHSLSYNYSKHQSFPDLLQLLKEQYSNHFTLEASIYPQNRLSELNDRQKHFLYRCTQELVTNIYKHAKATEVSLSISIDHQITLVVEDDGIGFNTEAHNKGIGLLNIQERVANLEGTLHIDSHPQRGTTVIIEIPN